MIPIEEIKMYLGTGLKVNVGKYVYSQRDTILELNCTTLHIYYDEVKIYNQFKPLVRKIPNYFADVNRRIESGSTFEIGTESILSGIKYIHITIKRLKICTQEDCAKDA